jgi:hypothetical protein
MSATVETTALATRKTVEDLVRVYEQAERDIRAGFALVEAAQQQLGDAFQGSGRMSLARRGRHEAPYEFGEAEATRVLAGYRRQCWATLIERLELRRICSISRWEKLWKQVHDGPDSEVPEITVELVLGMAEGFRSQMGDMIRESVREVYDMLRPRNSEYKTNSEFGIGKRVILSYFVERWSAGWQVRIGSHRSYSQELSALENVFRTLDGRKHGTDGYRSEIETAIRAIEPGAPCAGETTYFRFRGHQKGTLHLEFTRPDLVALFNQVAGGGMLPQRGDAPKRRGPAPADVLTAAIEKARAEGFPGADPNFFGTPWDLAGDLAGMLDLAPGLTVLEPSAGRGALVRGAVGLCPEARFACVEQDQSHSRALLESLREAGSVRWSDFLAIAPGDIDPVERVLMNPPFSHQRDILHVFHAFQFLKPGGVLVAVMSGGSMFRDDKLSRAFREFVRELDGEVKSNDPRAFRDSGTNVRTVTVRLVRP